MTGTAEYNKDADLGEYYTYDAVVNGEITTIDFDFDDAAVDTVSGVAIYKSLRYNSDGLALNTGSEQYTTSGDEYYVTGVAGGKAEDGAISVDSVYYTLGDDVDVFEVNKKKDKFSSSSIGRIAAGDSATLIVRNGEVVAIFWTEAAE